ncbi:MAG: tetratricopeptide repeat protein, partial [Candidatus Nitrotoga sp.]
MEAEPIIERALSIDGQAFGKDHPDVATVLSNLASLFEATHRYNEAEPLRERALRIDGQIFGNDHPQVASDLSNLAILLHKLEKPEEALSLFRRAIAIALHSESTNKQEHPALPVRLRLYRSVMEDSGLDGTEQRKNLMSLGTEAGWQPADWQKKLAALLPPSTFPVDQASAAAVAAFR